jgi:mannose-6-phosphate isomerase
MYISSLLPVFPSVVLSQLRLSKNNVIFVETMDLNLYKKYNIGVYFKSRKEVMPGIALLDNPVQEYAWGSKTFIPRLLGKPFPSPTPQAELWMGAHPHGTSRVLREGRWAPLSDLIKKDPLGILGKSTAARFCNRLPFLFKVLAASKPLSIQAHPNRGQALEGFEREKKQGIPVGASSRSYRDPFHKPEILCALTPFWALKGFRTVKEIRSILHRIGFPAASLPSLQEEDGKALRKLFTALFTMNREDQRRLVSDLVSAAASHASSDPVFEWILRLQEDFPYDIGVLGPVLLNLIHLQPGEALSIAAGELHSYLEGAGIEVMANSDNVLRGGLTEKHMDIPELLKILSFSPGERRILHPQVQGSTEWLYPEGAEEFLLSRMTLESGMLYQCPVKRSTEIMICVRGRVEVSDSETGETLSLLCGSSVIVPALVKGYRVKGAGTLYKAAVPPG